MTTIDRQIIARVYALVNTGTMQRLGEKLHILREYHGITQHHLAKQLHMSRSFISDMENGRKIPNVAHILKIADFFGVSADVLVLDDLEIDFDDG